MRGTFGEVRVCSDGVVKRPLSKAARGVSKHEWKALRALQGSAFTPSPKSFDVKTGSITMSQAPGLPCDKIVPLRRFRFGITHLRQLQNAIYYLWAKGWVHGDIKPANMVYDLQLDRFVIVDFGLAAQHGSHVLSNSVYSYRYRPPELCLFERNVRACSTTDVWAMGVTFCELHLHEFGVTLEPSSRMHALRWVDVALALVANDELRECLREMLQVLEPRARRLSQADIHALTSCKTSRARFT